MPRSEKKSFFPPCNTFSCHVVSKARDHALKIVSSWAGTKYTNTLRRKLWYLWQGGFIDDASYTSLRVIGKRSVDVPTPLITQEFIDLYWMLFLLDTDMAGKIPTISDRCGMMMGEMTSRLEKPKNAVISTWWLGFSNLQARKWIHVPLQGNPYIKDLGDASKGIFAHKTKQGRWRFEICDTKEWNISSALPNKKIGVDVGFSTIAALSNGQLFGTKLKAKFNAMYIVIKNIRANRQRQGLRLDSLRLSRLETKLTGLVKTMVGQITNEMLRLYPGYVFVFEDLNLSGCKGAQRFAYRALYRSAAMKMPTEVVNPAYTSQQCPSCGFVSRRNRNGIKFHCRSCGRKSHADVVGGINLLGRSEDKQIGLDDNTVQVKRVLRGRFLLRRKGAKKASPVRARIAAPVPSGPDLTVRAPSVGPRIDLNQVPTQLNLGW